MKKLLFIVLVLALATGCAAPNYVRITSLDASGQWIPFADATVGGCAVYTKGKVKGVVLTYTDKTCTATYTSPAKPAK